MLVMTTANDLIVVFVALEVLSIPLYVLAAFDRRRLALAGSRHQVLRARRVLVGDLPVRHRARLRRHRHHVAHRHRRLPRRATRCSRQGTLLAGLRAAARRARLQGRGGAVPHVDARRVPGRAHAGHRVHGRRRPRWRASPRCCGSSLVAFPLYRDDWRPVDLGARGPHAGRREHRRGRADRREAHARVLVDQPRRLRAHRRSQPRGRRAAAARGRRRRSSTCSSTRS